MPPVSTARLWILRAGYAFMGVGLLFSAAPDVIRHPADFDLERSVVRSLLTAIMLCAFLGIRYPLRMIPILLFEFAWKTIWTVAFFLPRALAHLLTADTWSDFYAIALGVVIVPLIIPWRYTWAAFVTAPATRWRGAAVE